MKIERGLLFLFFLAIIDALLYELVFQAEKTLGLIYSLSAFFVCVAASLILGILSKDPHWIMLNHTTFSQQEVEIREGDTMRFINPASGAPQRLCLDPERGSHQLRGSGVIIAPGQALHALFPNVGDYRVTSVENPEMVLRIRVSEPPPWHEPGI